MTSPKFERFSARESIVGTDTRIRRALPNARKRTIGAWCFLDHVGPVQFEKGKGLHVGPHPHIGLQTFTWMIEGEIMHRDSLGNEQVITPGQVNLMTAGNGVTHTEDSVQDGTTMHAAQLWIALPEHRRHGAAAFANYADLPKYRINDITVVVLAGAHAGHVSPAEVHTPLVGLDLSTGTMAGNTTLPLQPSFEYGFLVLQGTAAINGDTLEPGTLLYLNPGAEALDVSLESNSRVLVVGGEPFEDILIWWNFVARTQDEMISAITDWNEGTDRFPRPRAGSNSPVLKAPPIESIRLKTTTNNQ